MQGDQKSRTVAESRGQDKTPHLARADDATGSVEEADSEVNSIVLEVDPGQVDAAGRVRKGWGSARPAGGLDEDELIKRSLDGDQDAFELIVRRFSPRVFNIIGSFFRKRDMVEDIAQEVFAKTYFSLSSFTMGRSFEAWIAKIAVNACYDQLRTQRRRSEHQSPQYAEQEDEWFELQMLEAARDRHASAERQREAADIADRLLSKLDPEDRIVLVLMDRDGFSVGEISEITGWGQSKIKVRAFRARRTLRAAMKRLLMNAERKQRSLK